MSDENDGVLGNLPRSRPGVRSDKRTSAKRAAGTAKPRAAKPRAAKAPAAKPRAATPRAAQARAAKPPPPPPPPPAPPKSDDPLSLALGAATQMAETGLKVAVRVAGGVLRRFPRP
jgi:hypothetical protein